MTQSTFDQAVSTFERLDAKPSASDIISLSNYLASLVSVQEALGSAPPTLIEQALASETVINFLLAGRKILAIKELRTLSGGVGLKESKDAIESPEVQAELARQRALTEPMPDWERELLGWTPEPLDPSREIKAGDRVVVAREGRDLYGIANLRIGRAGEIGSPVYRHGSGIWVIWDDGGTDNMPELAALAHEAAEVDNAPLPDDIEFITRAEDVVHGFVKGERVTVLPNPVYISTYDGSELSGSWLFQDNDATTPLYVKAEQYGNLAEKNVLVTIGDDAHNSVYLAPKSLTRYVEPEPPEPEVFLFYIEDYFDNHDPFAELVQRGTSILSAIDYDATKNVEALDETDWRVLKPEAVKALGEFKPVLIPTPREFLENLEVGQQFGPDRDGDLWKKVGPRSFSFLSKYAHDFVGGWTLDSLVSSATNDNLFPNGLKVA